jgi:hypothetical protein
MVCARAQIVLAASGELDRSFWIRSLTGAGAVLEPGHDDDDDFVAPLAAQQAPARVDSLLASTTNISPASARSAPEPAIAPASREPAQTEREEERQKPARLHSAPVETQRTVVNAVFAVIAGLVFTAPLWAGSD